MYEKLNTVDIGEYKLPIRCNIYVLSALQAEFESISKFQQKLIGMKPKTDKDGNIVYTKDGLMDFTMGEPKIEAIIFAMPLMIKEGIKKASEQGEDVDYSEIDWKPLFDEMDFDYVKVAIQLNEEFQRCFNRKKKRMNSKGTRKARTMKSTSTES